jgi:hypothetical protein
VLRTITSAAGTTAPDGSVTVPVMVADPESWANAALEIPINKAGTRSQCGLPRKALALCEETFITEDIIRAVSCR